MNHRGQPRTSHLSIASFDIEILDEDEANLLDPLDVEARLSSLHQRKIDYGLIKRVEPRSNGRANASNF